MFLRIHAAILIELDFWEHKEPNHSQELVEIRRYDDINHEEQYAGLESVQQVKHNAELLE